MTDDPGPFREPTSAPPSPGSNKPGRTAVSVVGLIVTGLLIWYVVIKPLASRWLTADPAIDSNKSGLALYQEGRYEDALHHFERALAADEETHGKDRPNGAAALNNIGMVLKAQGKCRRPLRSVEIVCRDRD